ncbi:hypothetical protein C8R45DRAFT_1175360 [Mycena sanguinolenta]|nr:hypothetical protein C8R45DRAFT_1175360 [Mycena sanguinolenta]
MPQPSSITRAISQWFPNELLTQIVQAVSKKADTAALCQVSKLFYGLSVPILYHSVYLEADTNGSSDCIAEFCYSIASTPFLAALVRFVRVDMFPNRWASYKLHREVSHVLTLLRVRPQTNLVLESFKLLACLEVLSIKISLKTEIELDKFRERKWTFPRLAKCHLGLTVDKDPGTAPALSFFLSGHPNLTSFWFWGATRLVVKEPFFTSLPNLQYFRGLASLTPALMTGHLRGARLDWGREDNNSGVEKNIVALKQLTSGGTPFICANDACDDQFAKILRSLSTNIPYITTLEMRVFGIDNSGEPQRSRDKMVAHVKEYLPHFECLAFISIEIECPVWSNRFNRKEAERATIDFAKLCPTLEACSLTDLAFKKVNGSWEEFPSMDFYELSGMNTQAWCLMDDPDMRGFRFEHRFCCIMHTRKLNMLLHLIAFLVRALEVNNRQVQHPTPSRAAPTQHRTRILPPAMQGRIPAKEAARTSRDRTSSAKYPAACECVPTWDTARRACTESNGPPNSASAALTGARR